MPRASIHGEWSTRLAFILAATGSAVGLGNIWKFPYMAGENGGGVFVLVYLACVALIALPIMIAEIFIGRRGRRNPMDSMLALAEDDNRSGHWQWIGLIGVAAAFLILSYYSVVAGWTLAYILRAGSGMFEGITGPEAQAVFAEFKADAGTLVVYHTIFLALTVFISARGVQGGLERAAKLLMPALFVLLVVMVGYAMSTGAFEQAVAFLFQPDFSKVTGGTFLAALGQAFFSLSLGMGAIMIYGSYLPSSASIHRSAFAVALADTGIALLAGLAVFPIVFANQLEPGSGPGLIFETLPLAFGQMPAGSFFAVLFFILLAFGAWTSAISLMEPPVTWLVERRDIGRVPAAIMVGAVVWLLGLGTAFSFNIWSEAKLFGRTIFGNLDYLTVNIMLPVGGFAMAVFAAWIVSREATRDELADAHPLVFACWRVALRYVAPVGVVIVFLNAIGAI